MTAINEKQLKNDLLALLVLGMISTGIAGVGLTYGINSSWTSFAGQTFFMVVSIGFLVADYYIIKLFAKRLSSLKLLIVTSED